MTTESKRLLAITVLFTSAAMAFFGSFWIFMRSPWDTFRVFRQICPQSSGGAFHPEFMAPEHASCDKMIVVLERLFNGHLMANLSLFVLSLVLIGLGVFINNNWEAGDEYVPAASESDAL